MNFPIEVSLQLPLADLRWTREYREVQKTINNALHEQRNRWPAKNLLEEGASHLQLAGSESFTAVVQRGNLIPRCRVVTSWPLLHSRPPRSTAPSQTCLSEQSSPAWRPSLAPQGQCPSCGWNRQFLQTFPTGSIALPDTCDWPYRASSGSTLPYLPRLP